LPPRIARVAASLKDAGAFLGARPDAIALTAGDAPGAVPAEIYSCEPFGKHTIITVALGELLLKLKASAQDALRVGDKVGQMVGLTFSPGGLMLFDATTGRAQPEPN
jgi:multiple sugar transport system ATP-binding protein